MKCLGAYSRADIDAPKRRDFFVYVDKLQSFTTLALADMLSEMRKYRVGITVAHQSALLVFSRNKDFSKVLESLWETVEAHPQLKRSPYKEGETRRRYIFAKPEDSNREIILTVLIISVPAET